MLKHAEKICKLTRRQKADLLTGRDFWTTHGIEEIGLPQAWLADGPSGVRKQVAASDHLGLNPSLAATCLPSSASICNSWNPELIEGMGKLLGEEAAAQGVNMLLGPGINIKRNPLCGRNFEYYSEDPYLAGKMSAAYIRGIQSNGIYACVKHFAANNQELRRMVSDSVVDERALREIYLTAFEIAVKEGGAKAVMSSYNRINGVFADQNRHLLSDILRGEWGFEGVVVSDWAGTNDKVESVKAGSDLEMPSCRYGADDVYAALEDGTLDESLVDECLDRLIEFAMTTDAAVKKAVKEYDISAHHAAARKCAEESIVLLKNDGVLPLGSQKVCFIGDFADKPRFQGAGSSIVNPSIKESFLTEVGNHNINYIGYAPGYKRYGGESKSLAKKALDLAARADTVVFFAGLDEVTEAEGLDRRNMKLPQNQLELFKSLCSLGKKVVVLLFCGAPVELGMLNGADALVHAYLGGQAGVSAMLNVLTGAVNPSGKLSESYPASYGSCPSASHFPGRQMTVEYRESIFVGYRYYATAGVGVDYPFGYGLSYTTFEYSDISADGDGVEFTLTNTGSFDGAEVCQLYISKPQSAIFRPAIELKGFKKVFLKAGESAKVRIPFDEYSFRSFNPKAGKWQTEGGEYILSVGSSSADIRLKCTVGRTGDMTDFGYDRRLLPDYFSGNAADIDGTQYIALLGHRPPKSGYDFYKKNRMVIGENSTVADLRYSKRWVGRAFSGAIRLAIWFMYSTGNRMQANTLVQGMLHQPVRGLAKYGGLSRRQMQALIMMFNGHLFKGIGTFLTKQKKGGKDK